MDGSVAVQSRAASAARHAPDNGAMSAALQLGPLALPWSLVFLIVATALGWWVGLRLGKHHGVDVDPHLWRVLLVALVVARLAFVWPYRQAYLASPLDILDIRDGGWEPQAGLVGAWLYVMLLAQRRPTVRRPVVGAVAVATALWLGAGIGSTLLDGERPPLPDFVLESIDGQSVPLQQYAGRPVVLNLWATWCPPCRREMPVLEAAQRQRPDVHIVFLNQGEAAPAVQRYLKASGLQLHNMLLDRQGQAAARYGRAGLPTTLFFDAQGRLVDQRLGELSAASLGQRLDRIAGPAPVAAPRPASGSPS